MGVIMRLRVLTAAGLALLVAACAGRDPQPVATAQLQDSSATCAQIQAEIQANNSKVQELADEQGLKTAQNVAAGVAGLVVWPLWFAMDFKGAASKEVTALQARQQYLAILAAERCAPAAAPARRATTAPPVAQARPGRQAQATQPATSGQAAPEQRLPPEAYYQQPPKPEPPPLPQYGAAN
jgi:hypothetical protein